LFTSGEAHLEDKEVRERKIPGTKVNVRQIGQVADKAHYLGEGDRIRVLESHFFSVIMRERVNSNRRTEGSPFS
jgi:hypothetical protein